MSDLIRICTAGSVDDGKSTLIGRLLHDSRALYEDQVSAVANASRNRGVGAIDFSLFTDGLKAEREQGITIDIAYRYFATAKRKFILADTPGHEQYTRNMATGASTADVAILLLDARHGVRPQTRRHAEIARLLGISSFVIAVNKLDLVDFDRDVFDAIVGEITPMLDDADVHAVPLSALHGDNVTSPSDRTPWYDGPGLLGYLETVMVARDLRSTPFRFPIQLVLRPNADFRGYAGRILSGTVRVGDVVTAWPSGFTTRILRIVTRDGDFEEAGAQESVVLTLERELDLSRGDVLAAGEPLVGTRFAANVVWMDERSLDPNRLYRLKQGTRNVAAEVDVGLELNAIGAVTVTTTRPVVYERYADNRGMGCFVLIDPDTNFTAGAGMISQPLAAAAVSGRLDGTSKRLAAVARAAANDADAVEAVRSLLGAVL